MSGQGGAVQVAEAPHFNRWRSLGQGFSARQHNKRQDSKDSDYIFHERVTTGPPGILLVEEAFNKLRELSHEECLQTCEALESHRLRSLKFEVCPIARACRARDG